MRWPSSSLRTAVRNCVPAHSELIFKQLAKGMAMGRRMLGVLVVMGALVAGCLAGCAAPPGPASSGGSAPTTYPPHPWPGPHQHRDRNQQPQSDSGRSERRGQAVGRSHDVGHHGRQRWRRPHARWRGRDLRERDPRRVDGPRGARPAARCCWRPAASPGRPSTGDGEVGVPYSEVRLTVEETRPAWPQPDALARLGLRRPGRTGRRPGDNGGGVIAVGARWQVDRDRRQRVGGPRSAGARDQGRAGGRATS